MFIDYVGKGTLFTVVPPEEHRQSPILVTTTSPHYCNVSLTFPNRTLKDKPSLFYFGNRHEVEKISLTKDSRKYELRTTSWVPVIIGQC